MRSSADAWFPPRSAETCRRKEKVGVRVGGDLDLGLGLGLWTAAVSANVPTPGFLPALSEVSADVAALS